MNLKHYGVKGMKWGLRRSEEELAEGGESGGGGDIDEELEEIYDKIEDSKNSEERQKQAVKLLELQYKATTKANKTLKKIEDAKNLTLDKAKEKGISTETDFDKFARHLKTDFKQAKRQLSSEAKYIFGMIKIATTGY